mmetsp:Transcript_7341/g.22730  ORF Transcript_7341/g.22730 Transcript_7341/m.22730 type:complete len:203 (-) Transcript_7341:3-611(-)
MPPLMPPSTGPARTRPSAAQTAGVEDAKHRAPSFIAFDAFACKPGASRSSSSASNWVTKIVPLSLAAHPTPQTSKGPSKLRRWPSEPHQPATAALGSSSRQKPSERARFSATLRHRVPQAAKRSGAPLWLKGASPSATAAACRAAMQESSLCLASGGKACSLRKAFVSARISWSTGGIPGRASDDGRAAGKRSASPRTGAAA